MFRLVGVKRSSPANLVVKCLISNASSATSTIKPREMGLIPHLSDFIRNRPSSASDSKPDSIENSIKTRLSLKFHVETYGCQMNLSDTEIVRSILLAAGHTETGTVEEAELIFQNTCAIRENAESKIWNRLNHFRGMRRRSPRKGYPKVGILGCMAERLKEKLLEENAVDLVCGPDAYRDLPRLLESVLSSDQKEANTQLSFEETYADINPVRTAGSESAFVSIMRGCNNMCSFCVVPFTRGRERSREMSSIISEITRLVTEEGIKEVVLLGQNVNGFHDTSPDSALLYPQNTQYQASSEGFTNLFQSRNRDKPGARFSDLLLSVADISPDLRVRFTSPHPKDFPSDVLSVVASHPNICASLHLPVQSGSTSVLARMRRGYTRETYLQLVRDARTAIPGVKISTDVITGFCGETEEEHRDTVLLMEEVKYDQAFMFAYSLRDKTHAARTMEDDVSEETKGRRLREIIEAYRRNIISKNKEEESGVLRLVLVEGLSSKATSENQTLTGRTDGNQRVVFDAARVTDALGQSEAFVGNFDCNNKFWDDRSLSRQQVLEALTDPSHLAEISESYSSSNGTASDTEGGDAPSSGSRSRDLKGRYVVVKILEAESTTLRGVALGECNILAWHARNTVATSAGMPAPSPLLDAAVTAQTQTLLSSAS